MTTEKCNTGPKEAYNIVQPCCLVVDDESFCHMARAVLNAAGLRTLMAPAGPEALDVLAQDTVDVVLANLRMNPIDGITLSGMIFRDFPGTQVIIHTAWNSVETKLHALSMGCADYLVKPCKLDVLLPSVVRAALLGPNNSIAYADADRRGEGDEFKTAFEQRFLSFGPVNGWPGKPDE